MSPDETLAAALNRLAHEREPAIGPVVTAGLAHGRRLRRRRWQTVGSVAAVAVVGTAGAFALAGRGAGRPAPVRPKPPTSLTAELESRLRTLSPHATFAPDPYVATSSEHPAQVSLAMTDDSGVGNVSVLATRYVNGFPPGWGVCPSKFDKPDDDCVRTELGGGALLIVDKTVVSGVKTWSASLTHPDGATVTVAETNYHADLAKSGARPAVPTRPLPPLTGEQLAAVAQDPVWRTLADVTTMMTPASPPDAAPAAAAARAVLPPGLTVVDKDPDPRALDYSAYVSDGTRYAVVTFSVRQHGTDVDLTPPTCPPPAEGPCRTAQVADGGWAVVTTHLTSPGSPSSGSSSSWQAELMTRSGSSVSIVEAATDAGHRPSTAQSPVLGVDELLAMVTSPKWGALTQ